MVDTTSFNHWLNYAYASVATACLGLIPETVESIQFTLSESELILIFHGPSISAGDREDLEEIREELTALMPPGIRARGRVVIGNAPPWASSVYDFYRSKRSQERLSQLSARP